MLSNISLSKKVDLFGVVAFTLFAFAIGATPIFGQTKTSKGRNNPYSPSPSTRAETTEIVTRPDVLARTVSGPKANPSETVAEYRKPSVPTPVPVADKKTPAETYR